MITCSLTVLSLLLAMFEFGGEGTAALPVLRVGQGARAAAMGGSFLALADDASALYWNPAGLGQVDDYCIGLSHHQWFAAVKDELLHLTFPGRTGALGIGLVYSGEPDIEYWSPGNQPGGTFTTWNGVASIGYGGTIAHNWHIGLGLKGFYQSLHTVAGYGGAFDVGFIGRPLPFASFGIVGRNIGLIRYGSTWEDLPTEVGIGTSLDWSHLTATADVVYPLDGSINCRAGLEYAPVPALALRVGYRTGPADLSSLGWLSGLTGGLGLHTGPLAVDYAIAPYGALGLVHRIGLNLQFEPRGSGRVVIRTVETGTLEPIQARVTLDGIRTSTALTDKLGRYDVTGLLPGKLIINTTLPGYVSRSDTMLIIGDRQQFATIDLRLMEYGHIWVAIYDGEQNKPVGGTAVYSGPIYGEQEIPGNPGSAAIRNVPTGTYILTVSGSSADYFNQTCTLEVLPKAVTERRFNLSRHHRTTDRPATTGFENIPFDSGSAVLSPTARKNMEDAAAILRASPAMVVELAGHTDATETGSIEHPSNWELSQARAEAVRAYLISKSGIAEERLIARGYADTQPVAGNDTEADMARNRRTEFRIIEQ